MKNSIKVIFIFLFFLLSLLELNAQGVSKPKSIKFLSPAFSTPINTNKQPLIDYSVKNALAENPYRERRTLKAVARKAYKYSIENKYDTKFKMIDASYGAGRYGIDGLLINQNRSGKIEAVHVFEIKSGKKNTIGSNNGVKQLSKDWILKSIDKSMKEKKSFKSSNLLYKTRQQIEANNYRRFLLTINYYDGKLNILSREVIGETLSETPGKGSILKFADKTETVKSFSYLQKDYHALSLEDKYIRKILFKEFEKELRNNRYYSKIEISRFMQRLKTDPKFNPSSSVLGQDVVNQITTKSLSKAIKNYKLETSILKCGYATLSVFFELKAISDYVEGNISKVDLFIHSITNTMLFSSLFTNVFNAHMNYFFIGIDAVKNLYEYGMGKISVDDVIANITANVSGLFVGGLITNTALSAMYMGRMGQLLGTAVLSPIGGAIVGGLVFTLSYSITNAVVRWIVHGYFDRYEAIKSREHFEVICDDIAMKYSLNV